MKKGAGIRKKNKWCNVVWLMVMAAFLTGCGYLASSVEVPSEALPVVPAETSRVETVTEPVQELPAEETVTEPVVIDYTEKPGSQAQYVASYPVDSVARYDLNGDGIGEDISVTVHEYEAGKLTIGEASIEIWICTPTGYFTVLNVDDSDNRLLVGISDYGPSDDPGTLLYAYDGMSIREIGYLSDIIGRNVYGHEGATCHGDGTITAGSRWDVLGTWGTVGLYRVNENSIEDITEFYPYIGWDENQTAWSVTARVDIFMRENENAEDVIIVPAGTTVNMLGLRKGADDDTYLVAFEVPALGKDLWLRTERVEWQSYLETGIGFVSSEEAFDGFFYAG